MHYFSNKFSKIVKPLNFGDLKLRDLAKLCFFKLIITKLNLKKIRYNDILVTFYVAENVANITPQGFSTLDLPIKISYRVEATAAVYWNAISTLLCLLLCFHFSRKKPVISYNTRIHIADRQQLPANHYTLQYHQSCCCLNGKESHYE